MRVMVVDEDAGLRTAVTAAFAPLGCEVMSFGRLGPARAAAREGALDLLVLGERVDGRLAHDLALLAEWRNPLVGSVLLSDRAGEEAEELFALLPSLRAVLGRRTGAGTLARVALASADGEAETAGARLARRWAEAGGDGIEEVDEGDRPIARLPSFLERARGLAMPATSATAPVAPPSNPAAGPLLAPAFARPASPSAAPPPAPGAPTAFRRPAVAAPRACAPERVADGAPNDAPHDLPAWDGPAFASSRRAAGGRRLHLG